MYNFKENYDVVIVGAGPAGIFSALGLCESWPEAKVLVVDTGRSMATRTCPARITGVCVHCKPCSIMHGWAGAGAFSDGKLSLSHEVGGHIASYLGEKRANELIAKADKLYLQFGAGETVHGLNDKKIDEIQYEASKYNIKLVPCPVRHLGTENSAKVLGAMESYIQNRENMEFRQLTSASTILVENNRVVGLNLKTQKGEEYSVAAKHIIVAPGRGGADWLTREAKRLGLKISNNEVDIGVRVEVPNSVMDHLTKHLYEAKLIYYSDTYENKVRTFCMNPGGEVSQEYYEGGIAVVNGHSYDDESLRTKNTNFAMLVSTTFTEPFDKPIEYGRYIAQLGNMLTGGPIMVQRLGDLLKGRRTTVKRLERSTTVPTLSTAVPGDLSFVLPPRHLTSIVEALKAFDNIAPGLYSKNTLLYGVEVKFYSSKVLVDNSFMTTIDGLYCIGDGAGVTRGLMQASATGLSVSETISKLK